MAGPSGVNKKINRIPKTYVWPGMTKDIKLYYKSYKLFSFFKGKDSVPKTPLQVCTLI